jgi:hypothetical protein
VASAVLRHCYRLAAKKRSRAPKGIAAKADRGLQEDARGGGATAAAAAAVASVREESPRRGEEAVADVDLTTEADDIACVAHETAEEVVGSLISLVLADQLEKQSVVPDAVNSCLSHVFTSAVRKLSVADAAEEALGAVLLDVVDVGVNKYIEAKLEDLDELEADVVDDMDNLDPDIDPG